MPEDDQVKNGKKDVSLYEKLVARTEKLLESGRKNLDEALKKAGDELEAAGEFTREQADKISQFVRRDLEHTVKDANKAKESLKEAVDPSRIAAGAQSIFARILSASADTLNEWAQKSQQNIEFKTGEVTSPGTLTCKNCGEQIQMKKTARIPPCPKCFHPHFRKSY